MTNVPPDAIETEVPVHGSGNVPIRVGSVVTVRNKRSGQQVKARLRTEDIRRIDDLIAANDILKVE